MWKYGIRALRRVGCLNVPRSGISPISNWTMTRSLVAYNSGWKGWLCKYFVLLRNSQDAGKKWFKIYLLYHLMKSSGSYALRRFPDSLIQILKGRWIIQLYCFDSAKIVHVSSDLIIWGWFGKSRLRDEFISLINQVRVQIVSQESVQERSLTFMVIC